MAKNFPSNTLEFNQQVRFRFNFDDEENWQIVFLNIEHIPFAILSQVKKVGNEFEIKFKCFGYRFKIQSVEKTSSFEGTDLYEIGLIENWVDDTPYTLTIPETDKDAFANFVLNIISNTDIVSPDPTFGNGFENPKILDLKLVHDVDPTQIDVDDPSNRCCPGRTCAKGK